MTETTPRRLRLGMVGGGEGAFIGAVHRIAARLDDCYELVAGALSSDATRSVSSAATLRIAADRAYPDFNTMAQAEAVREDGIDVVAIVTPNNLHYPVAKTFLGNGIHVICDKPLTSSLQDALDLAKLVKKTGLVFGLTHNYTGYPMVRQARNLVREGKLGTIRVVQAEYAQDWLTTNLEDSGHKQASWRTDPAQSGAGGCLGDIGTHAYNLATFISGLETVELCAELSAFVPGRRLDDNAQIMLRFDNGARGMLWASQVAPGNENGLRIRIYGDAGGLEWEQEHPNQLHYTPFGEPPQLLSRAGAGADATAAHASRIPAGHPEGYLEGFANLYRDIAEVINARIEGRSADPMAVFPTVEDGALGMKFIDAAVTSSQANGAWVDARIEEAGS